MTEMAGEVICVDFMASELRYLGNPSREIADVQL